MPESLNFSPVLAACGSGTFQATDQEGVTMSNADDLQGRVKEAVGDLTDDKDLKREGQVDKATGMAKDAIDDVADKAKDVLGTKD
jgi:uncharacterized protein YjbJ (UPF0337 family)